jgi:glycerol-3-phosphate dehydrogenase
VAASPLVVREEALRRLQVGVDVLVIGGGITGAGVALDAVTRGYRVGLVEQQDFAGGTSSRSTKLVHGGLRYVPQWQFGLVREALAERERLQRLAPHLVAPLPFLIPVYRGLRQPLGIRLHAAVRPLAGLGIRIGLAGYDLLARSAFSHRALAEGEGLRYVPALRTEGLTGSFLYYDAQTDDVRLTHAVLATARRQGATTLNYARAVAIRFDDRARVMVLDRLGGASIEVTARHVVNAAGIWAERVATLAGSAPFRIRHSKGTHLILDRPGLVNGAALVIPETDDGRLAFLLPWRGRLILGTTDDAYEGELGAPTATVAEARYLLEHLNRYLRHQVASDAVIGAYTGLRPLIARGNAPSAELSRGHEVVQHDSGLVSIIGGKLTIYRKMAQDAVDVLARRDGFSTPSRTADLVLAGGEDLPAARVEAGRRGEALGLTPDHVDHLIGTYGRGTLSVLELIQQEPALARPFLPDLPVLRAEVVVACREEGALTLTDWMFLRSRLALLDRHQARGCVGEAADLMGRELGWAQAESARQVAAFEETVAAEMAFLTSLKKM